MTRRPLVAGNWKMNLNHLEAIGLVQKIAFSLEERQLEQAETAVFPPFTSLRSVQTLVEGDQLDLTYGAQDVSAYDAGAYTGEISGSMLTKLGCTYVLVSHSERREYHFEDDSMVNAKMHAATRAGLRPVICVGESLKVRETGGHKWFTLGQLSAGMAGIPADLAASAVVAYEPVWAIGTGKTASSDDAQEMCSAIRDQLAEMYSGDVADQVRILYGGSVKAGNAAELAAQPDVDGALVGGASLDGAEFAGIVKAFAASVA